MILSQAMVTVVGIGFTGGVQTAGGAIWSAGAISLIDCSFSGNRATKDGGGAVFVDDALSVLIDRCFFEKNSSPFAPGLGGAVMIAVKPNVISSIVVSNTFFSGNLATFGAGAFLFVRPPPT